ncbi:MAG: putative capsular polysaccharide synthesis family protein, partial [Planctomycetota bacterium]|nr:putative capsular polysaccharide synthesis family protein [Planctomycetota bacterium]
FLNDYLHSRPLTWFDVELKSTLGIDVYEHSFPKEAGYLAVSRENVDLLVLKCELSDALKEQAISRFLGIDDFTITRSNVTARKATARTYEEFTKAIQLPDSYIDTMYGSKYAQHFYGEQELAQFRHRWQGKTLPQESGERP